MHDVYKWVLSVIGGVVAAFFALVAAAVMLDVVTGRNIVCDRGGCDEINDYFSLLSRREVYMGDEVASVIEGKAYPYCSEYFDLSATDMGNDSNRVKYQSGSARGEWLRTPTPKSDTYVRAVGMTGALGIHYANINYGIVSVCNI